jgi:excisionase family DNA binding protein
MKDVKTTAPVPTPSRSSTGRLLVTPIEAAAMLSVGRTTLYYLARDGDITPVRIGRATRFSIADLEAYVATRMGAPQGGDDHSETVNSGAAGGSQ